MRKTPLLPRFCPVPLAGDGDAHSTWRCASPKPCFVWIEPVPRTTSIYPSATFQRAAEPRLSVLRQLSSDRPSNSTTASDGGGTGGPAGPGVTTGGCGRSSECMGNPPDASGFASPAGVMISPLVDDCVTGLRSTPTPSSSISTTSPALIGRVVPGVPV